MCAEAGMSGVLRGVGLEPASGLFGLFAFDVFGETAFGELETTTSGSQSTADELWIRREDGRLFLRVREGESAFDAFCG